MYYVYDVDFMFDSCLLTNGDKIYVNLKPYWLIFVLIDSKNLSDFANDKFYSVLIIFF